MKIWYLYVPLRCMCVFQLYNGSLWLAVFIAWHTAGSHYYACTPPRQKHYGLFTVALGNSVLHEHQHCEGHQKQPFHICCAGQLLFWTVTVCKFVPSTFLKTYHLLCHSSWEFRIHLSWWATSTNSRMMIRPRSRALSSMCLCILPFNNIYFIIHKYIHTFFQAL